MAYLSSCCLYAHNLYCLLQLALQGQATSGKQQRNAAILQWHQATKEEVRLARYATQLVHLCCVMHLQCSVLVQQTH